jgi:hypothetical protein
MRRKAKSIIPDEVVMSKILVIRGQKVMLDIDLAELYQVETGRLNEQVKRNLSRFPSDFMFQLNVQEWKSLRSQFAISNIGRGGRRYAPLAFTEHGVLMLSSVLNSERSIQVNIQIMRTYSKLRQIAMNNKEFFLKLEQMERRVTKHDKSLRMVFAYLKELFNPQPPPLPAIGFRQKGLDD